MNIHILAPPHSIPIWKESLTDAFTQRALNLCVAMRKAGHQTFLYGVEGGDTTVCDNYISLIDRDAYDSGYSRQAGQFFDTRTDNPICVLWNKKAAHHLGNNVSPDDIVCCSFGKNHQLATEGCVGHVIESGIGYNPSATFAKNRIYESQMWLHFHLGSTSHNGIKEWVCIYNVFDPEDFCLSLETKPYLLFVARLGAGKGEEIAIETAQAVGMPLIIAGPGDPSSLENRPGVHYVGEIDKEQRKLLLSTTTAFLAPSQYVEPLGYSHLEAMMSGVPVITSDFGAYVETVPDESWGYRCRTKAQYIQAAKKAAGWKLTDRADLRQRMTRKFGWEQFTQKHLEYFEMLRDRQP